MAVYKVAYKNLGGDSSVTHYMICRSGIRVWFKHYGNWGGIKSNRYAYYNDSCGASAVNYMKALAQTGQGLNSYISKNKPKYLWRDSN